MFIGYANSRLDKLKNKILVKKHDYKCSILISNNTTYFLIQYVIYISTNFFIRSHNPMIVKFFEYNPAIYQPHIPVILLLFACLEFRLLSRNGRKREKKVK